MAYDLLSAPGVLARHVDDCPARDGGRCTCGPIGYRAPDEGRPIGPLMETAGEALRWRREQFAALDDAERGVLVGAAIDDFLNDAATGDARAADGRRYTGTERRALRHALTREVTPGLGGLPLHEVRPRHLHPPRPRAAARLARPPAGVAGRGRRGVAARLRRLRARPGPGGSGPVPA